MRGASSLAALSLDLGWSSSPALLASSSLQLGVHLYCSPLRSDFSSRPVVDFSAPLSLSRRFFPARSNFPSMARPCFLLLDAASSRPWSSPLAAPSCSFLVLAPAPATNAVEPVVFPVQFSRGFLLASALSQLRSAAPLVPCPWWCCGVATLCPSRQPSWPQEQSTPYSSPSHDLALLLASPFIKLIQHLPYPSHSPCLLEFPPWPVIVCARAQLRLITSVSFFDLVLASTWL
jgi:hypothetical protein